jgi:DNA-binding response OmpR family regulator
MKIVAQPPEVNRMKLLIVEDNLSLVTNLFEYFEARGHVLDAAPDGVTGLHLAINNSHDAIMLDWTLPRLQGPDLVRRMRNEPSQNTPVLMLTARDALSDKLTGFHAGADDYLTKPFALPELEVRLHALIARGGARARPVLEVGDLRLDTGTLLASRGGETLKLYPACRKLLEALMRASPAVVSRESLEHTLWGDSPPDADLLRSHIYELRRAVDDEHAVKLIHTVPRVGYRLGSADTSG